MKPAPTFLGMRDSTTFQMAVASPGSSGQKPLEEVLIAAREAAVSTTGQEPGAVCAIGVAAAPAAGAAPDAEAESVPRHTISRPVTYLHYKDRVHARVDARVAEVKK